MTKWYYLKKKCITPHCPRRDFETPSGKCRICDMKGFLSRYSPNSGQGMGRWKK